MSSISGIIFDCKRFAVHDGEGIRSTLFLKGCPLKCPWCQNPEGVGSEPFLWYRPAKCLHCGSCTAVCEEKALSLDTRIHVDHSKCSLCAKCVDACPGGALEICGKTVTSGEAVEMLLRDRVFFGSEGGVTLSGGEVLYQWQFAYDVLKECRSQGVNTAIESCLYARREAVEAMTEVVDRFIIDIKILDSDLHEKVCGVPNGLILDNYRYLVSRGCDILVRTPVIPGYTDGKENLDAISEFINRVNPGQEYELLQFNPLCASKYESLEKDFPVEVSK